MKKGSIGVLLILFILSCLYAQQDNSSFVDVAEVNEVILSLNRNNEVQRDEISKNTEKVAELESRIGARNSRLEEIEADLASSRESNRELNDLYRDTADLKTRNEIESCRAELLSILWLLTNEKESLTDLNKSDKNEIVLLNKDIERRERILVRNSEETAVLEQSVQFTEAKINEISLTLKDISSSLSELRNEMKIQ